MSCKSSNLEDKMSGAKGASTFQVAGERRKAVG